MDNSQKSALAILALLGIPAFILLNALLDGCAFALLWKWFVVKTFDIKPISITEAIGIGIIVSLLTRHIQIDKDDREHPLLADTIKAIIRPLFFVFIGWIVKSFI